MLPAILFALPLALTQDLALRAPVSLGNLPSLAGSSRFAVGPDRAVFSVVQPAGGGLNVTWSDGRGLAWSAPLGLPLAPSGATLKDQRLLLAGDQLLVQWDDTRFHPGAGFGQPQSSPFLRRFDFANAQLGPELALPTFGLLGQVETRVREAVSAQVGGQSHVHLLLRTQRFFAPVGYEWRLLSSHDGGQSFPFVLDLALDTVLDLPTDLSVEGPNVHVLLREKHFRSLDGGQSLDPTADRILPIPPSGLASSVALHRAGGGLIAAWVRSELTPGGQKSNFVEASVSTDGGTLFGPLEVISSAFSSLESWVLHEAFHMQAAGTFVVAWRTVNQGFPQGFVRSASRAAALPWTTTDLTPTPIFGPQWVGLVADPLQRSRLVAVWSSVDLVLPILNLSVVRLSLDGGRSWGPSQAATTPGSLARHVGFEPGYQNAILITQGSGPWQAGGGRPQRILPSGFVAGPTQIGAQFRAFDDGSPQAWLLAALSTAPLPVPDGRLLGLGVDALLLESLNLALTGPLAAALDASGNGQLAALTLGLPAGLSLSLVGLSLDPQNFTIGDLSDVVSVTAN